MPISVSAAIIKHDGLYLAARRALHKSSGGWWEFPGGKIELGETPEEAIIREIYEELTLPITVTGKLGVFSTRVAGEVIELHCLYAALSNVEVNSNDLTISSYDHSEVKWLPLEELPTLDWTPADVPVVEALLGSASSTNHSHLPPS